MTLDEVKAGVADIAECAGDYEAAHDMEDRLYEQFVKYVKHFGPRNLSELAAEVLKTKSIDFPRYCA